MTSASRSVRIATHCTEADISRQHIGFARKLGMDVSGFLMMSHMSEPEAAGPAGQADGIYGAHCVYVTDSGGALTWTASQPRAAGGLRRGAEAGDRARHPRPPQPQPRRRQFDRRVRIRRGAASTPRWPAWAPGPATRRSRSSSPRRTARAGSHGCRPLQADGRRRGPGAAAAGPARCGRPRNPQPRLCRGLFQLPAPRREGQPGIRRRHPHHPWSSSAAPHGRRPGGHDRRRGPGSPQIRSVWASLF
jgi:hypothetical protein